MCIRDRYRILHDEPNPEMTSFVFRETLMTHLLLWGNAYAQTVSYTHLIKNDGRLTPVIGAAIHFRTGLAIPIEEIQGDGSRQ